MAAADERQSGQEAGEPGEAIEEVILRPEHDRRPHDGGTGNGLEHRLLAERFGAAIVGRRIRVGADRRNMDEALDAGGARRLGDGASAEDIDRIEALAP